MKKNKNIESVIIDEKHFVLNALRGRKTFSKMKKEFFYIDQKLTSNNVKVGVSTRKRTIKFIHLIVGDEPLSIIDIYNLIPGSWERKWLSQSQVTKICKHFKFNLKDDGHGSIILCKKDEFQEIEQEDPDRNLMFIKVYLDHEGDINIYKTSYNISRVKREKGFPFRIIIPSK